MFFVVKGEDDSFYNIENAVFIERMIGGYDCVYIDRRESVNLSDKFMVFDTDTLNVLPYVFKDLCKEYFRGGRLLVFTSFVEFLFDNVQLNNLLVDLSLSGGLWNIKPNVKFRAGVDKEKFWGTYAKYCLMYSKYYYVN